MVRRPDGRLNQRGASRVGCLLFVMIVVAITYFGIPIAGTYLRYYRFKNEVQTQARFAPSIDDGTIRRRLLLRIEELRLPDDARRIRILRISRPREIRISTNWEETLELPFYAREITFSIEIREPM